LITTAFFWVVGKLTWTVGLIIVLFVALLVTIVMLWRARRPRVKRGPWQRWEDIKILRYGHVDYSPFLTYKYDEPVGFGVELLTRLLEGTEIKLEPAENRSAWDTVIDDLQAGKFDVVATPLFQTFERSKKVYFTTPIFYCDIGLYCAI